jgi:shikimate dehydrogenase
MTGLLKQANTLNLKTVDGVGMLLHQAAPGFEAWFGKRPSVDAELRAKVLAA